MSSTHKGMERFTEDHPIRQAGLTQREWQVFELRELRGYSLRQTAQSLDIALSTVRDTIDRATRKLRKATST